MLGTRAEYQPQYELMQYQQKTLSTRVWPREQGKVAPGAAADVAAALYGMGCYEVSMGDTTGVGTPASVAAMFQARRRGPDLGAGQGGWAMKLAPGVALRIAAGGAATRLRAAPVRLPEPAGECAEAAQGGLGDLRCMRRPPLRPGHRACCRDVAAGVRGGGARDGAGGAHA